ncbi:N-acetyltransferase family protein [Roseibium hamelinense]|nr:N-acetyltransferase family protein [Roseibium hamelinense]
MRIRSAEDRDVPALLELHNHAVSHTTAAWTDQLATLETRHAWFLARRAEGFPILVAVDASDAVLGYGSYSWFRGRDGYRKTVEHSVYVDAAHKRAGIGRALLEELVTQAERDGFHAMVAVIDGENLASIRLHEKTGFVQTGRLPEVGTKFGRWLDLVLMTRLIDTAPPPHGGTVRS